MKEMQQVDIVLVHDAHARLLRMISLQSLYRTRIIMVRQLQGSCERYDEKYQ